jgi:DNA-binding protein H-NS
MKALSEKSVDELWAIREQVVHLLSSKMVEEKARLEERLRELCVMTGRASDARGKRSYPPVLPKYRNPARPSETWAGRGKQPRWLVAALRKGKRLADFRIAA